MPHWSCIDGIDVSDSEESKPGAWSCIESALEMPVEEPQSPERWTCLHMSDNSHEDEGVLEQCGAAAVNSHLDRPCGCDEQVIRSSQQIQRTVHLSTHTRVKPIMELLSSVNDTASLTDAAEEAAKAAEAAQCAESTVAFPAADGSEADPHFAVDHQESHALEAPPEQLTLVPVVAASIGPVPAPNEHIDSNALVIDDAFAKVLAAVAPCV